MALSEAVGENSEMSLLLLNKTLFRKTSFTEKVQISVNAICSCNIFLLMRKKWCLQKVYQFCPGYLKQTVSILYCWTIVSYPSRYNVWRLNCPFQIHAETSRKIVLSHNYLQKGNFSANPSRGSAIDKSARPVLLYGCISKTLPVVFLRY